MEDKANPTPALLDLTLRIVTVYVSHNPLPRSELPEFIGAVHRSLVELAKAAAPIVQRPPLPIRKTITPDYLVSLEDGRPYRSLRRHLRARGLTPEEYRAKWGLPNDYPMVARSLSERRSQIAKHLRQESSSLAGPAPGSAHRSRRVRTEV